MPNVALIPQAATSITVLTGEVDGYPITVHSLKLAKSDEPLEDGTSVTDHAVTLPEGLKVTGWISDMMGGGRPGAAWAAIRRINQDKTPLTAVTEWGTYTEMLLEEVEGHQEGRGCRFEMKLREVIRVGNPQSSLPPGTVSGPAADRTGSVDRGRIGLPESP